MTLYLGLIRFTLDAALSVKLGIHFRTKPITSRDDADFWAVYQVVMLVDEISWEDVEDSAEGRILGTMLSRLPALCSIEVIYGNECPLTVQEYAMTVIALRDSWGLVERIGLHLQHNAQDII